MFRIGEFSQIARVSGRLLRYYDSIGLLRPQRIDPETGYRYYSAGQLEQLNRILALKELGLSLDQVARMLDERISPAEIRGMLTLKKAELEQSLAAEAARLRHIESRLAQIEQQGSLGDYDVILKSAPASPFLALRATYARFEDVAAALQDIAHAARAQLLASDQLATIVRSGPLYQSHLAFGKLGVLSASRKRCIGPGSRSRSAGMTFRVVPHCTGYAVKTPSPPRIGAGTRAR